MGIEEKLALARREEATKQKAAEKQMLLDDLLKTHASIEEKYNIARGKLENAHQAFGNAQKEAYYKKQAAQQTERKRLEAIISSPLAFLLKPHRRTVKCLVRATSTPRATTR